MRTCRPPTVALLVLALFPVAFAALVVWLVQRSRD